jgi:hypothetical protein
VPAPDFSSGKRVLDCASPDFSFGEAGFELCQPRTFSPGKRVLDCASPDFSLGKRVSNCASPGLLVRGSGFQPAVNVGLSIEGL